MGGEWAASLVAGVWALGPLPSDPSPLGRKHEVSLVGGWGRAQGRRVQVEQRGQSAWQEGEWCPGPEAGPWPLEGVGEGMVGDGAGWWGTRDCG